MKYTTLGRTGVTVSRLCLGCMSYGTPAWRPWVLDESAAQPFFRRALEAGINFFDTADMYSLGVSEEVTGRALREYGRMEEIVLATKVNFPMSSGPNMGGLSRKHVVQGCEASLKRLGVETIDLYQIHRFDHAVPLDETLAALDLLVKQGKVRFIGASSGPAYRFAKALALSDAKGWARFASMQNHYNLLYREEEREMIPLCAEDGIAVIPWSPLARGLLAGTRKDAADTDRDAARRLRRLCAEPLRPSVRRRRHRGGEERRGRARRAARGRRARLAPLAPRRDGADHRGDEARASGDGPFRARRDASATTRSARSRRLTARTRCAASSDPLRRVGLARRTRPPRGRSGSDGPCGLSSRAGRPPPCAPSRTS